MKYKLLISFVTALLYASSSFAGKNMLLNGTVWSGTHSPLVKGTELFFQGDTLFLIDLDGYKAPDQYQFVQRNDTLWLFMVEEFSVSCRQEVPGMYRVFWANNGEKLLLKPIQDGCMERFTRLVAESPWYRKREREEIRQDWHFLDPEKEGVPGIALYEAYKLLKFKKSTPITVAIVDGPVQYNHPDLTDVMWTNGKEIPDNGTDDDQNVCKDDWHGWFFNCTRSGIPIENEQARSTQIVQMWANRFSEGTNPSLSGQDLKDYELYKSAKAAYDAGKAKADRFKMVFSDSIEFFKLINTMLLQSEEPVTAEQIAGWQLGTSEYASAARELVSEIYFPQNQSFDAFNKSIRKVFSSLKRRYSNLWLYTYNLEWKPRELVGDHPEIPYEKMYGSGKLKDPEAKAKESSTHLAGIIGGRRGNGKGVEGISDNVRIMTLGAFPATGSEREKDVANSIRYAAEMGAKIIVLPQTHALAPHQKTVNEAIRFAISKGVLIVHPHLPAGTEENSPTSTFHWCDPVFRSQSWIETGQSSYELNERLTSVWPGSGKNNPDVFAPGKDVFSCVNSNSYDRLSGQSVSTAVVAGVAALIWSYFPKLSARDVKNVLLQSVYKPIALTIHQPGSAKRVPFENLSSSGGIIHAKKAVLVAEKIARNKKS